MFRFSAWLKAAQRTRKAQRVRRPNRFRPKVLLLEDRLAPAVFTVTTTADETNPNDGVLSLREAIAAINVSSDLSNTIVLATGTYGIATGNSAFTINPGKALDLTIQGQGPSNTVINGNQQDSVFLIDGNSSGVHVSFNDLQITGGKAPNSAPEGGGINLLDSYQAPAVDAITLNDVLLTQNSANFGGTGGGIYSGYGNVTLNGSIVSNNNTGSPFTDGGGISTQTGNISLSGSSVSGNTAGRDGGGIVIEGSSGTLSILNSQVDNNTAGSDGGGIADFSNGGTLTIDSSTVSGNRATAGGGGGIGTNGATVLISNSTLNNNSAGGGGGGGLDDGGISGNSLTISGSILSNDSTGSGGAGGAVANFGALIVSITGSAFNNDSANGTTGSGGALFDNGANNLSISNSDLSGNTAGVDGGGFYGENSTISGNYTLTNDTFNNDAVSQSNSVGGGLFVNGVSLTLDTVTASGDSAVVDGGGVYSTTSNNLTVSNSTLENDRATGTGGEGGALYDSGASPETISGSILSGNTAVIEGGGLWSAAASSTIIGSAFNNDAVSGNISNGGGAFSSAALSVINSSFIGDSSKNAGGGLSASGSSVALTACTAENDTSGAGGGVAYNASGTLTVDHCTMSGDVATANGGGLDVAGASPTAVTIEYSSFLNDAASGVLGGGGILLETLANSATLTLEYSTVAFDHANGSTSDGGGLTVFGNGNNDKLEVLNSTIAGNTATGNGGGVAIDGPLNTMVADFLFATLDSNQAATGGGIFNQQPNTAVNLGDTIVADNSATTGPDLDGKFSDTLSGPGLVGHNLIGSTSGFTGLTNGTNGDQLGTDPKLNPLANNGGPTETNSLQAGSPAVDAGFTNSTVQGITTTDQRGETRPDGGNDNPDIGAFESNLG
jgi:CSLREA domain-containing protein